MKSVAIALGAIVLVLGVLVALVKLNVLPRPIIEIRNDNGRFVMRQLGEFSKNRYVIDTKTGRVWVFANVDPKGENEQLFPVPYYLDEQRTSLRAPVSRSQEFEQEIAPLTSPSKSRP